MCADDKVLTTCMPFFCNDVQAGTDKVTRHNYQPLYSKYFEHLSARRGFVVKKLFEIGFGCDMSRGIRGGKNLSLWRKYFPEVELWTADYDPACAQKYKAVLSRYNASMVIGDQGNITVLKEWVFQTGGGFDVIIDDGGHNNEHIYNSFLILFQHALNPGGLYVMEDLEATRLRTGGHSILNALKDWAEQLMTFTVQRRTQVKNLAYEPIYRMPPGIKSIDFFAESCAIVKCYREDRRCKYGRYVDTNLSAWPIP